jgi:hypothetical protein
LAVGVAVGVTAHAGSTSREVAWHPPSTLPPLLRCGTPCIEPFLQCKLQPQCRAVALNAEGSFGTLKSQP